MGARGRLAWLGHVPLKLTVDGQELEGDFQLHSDFSGEFRGLTPEDPRMPGVTKGPVEITISFEAYVDVTMTNDRLLLGWKRA